MFAGVWFVLWEQGQYHFFLVSIAKFGVAIISAIRVNVLFFNRIFGAILGFFKLKV